MGDQKGMGEEKVLYPHLDADVWLRSCEHEIIEPFEAKVTGEVPKWVSGAVVRNGSGATKIGDSVRFNHIFDGPALLHRYNISDGRVTYQCRWVRSRMLEQALTARRVVYTEFGTRAVPDPCHSIFKRMSLAVSLEKTTSDNTSVAIYPMGDQLYAFTETSVIHRIHPENLETLDRIDLMGKKVALVHHSAHPLIMTNGDAYNLGLSVIKGSPKHVIVKFPAKAKDMFESATVVAKLSPRESMLPSYMHSFGVTDNYWVIIEQSLTLSIKKALWSQLYSGDPTISWFKWLPKRDTHIVLLSRETGAEVARYSTPALFYMHVMNSFEQDGCVSIDLCISHDANTLNALYVHSLENAQSNAEYADWFCSRPARFKLPLPKDGVKPKAPIPVKPEIIADFGMEMPRFNDTLFLGKPYKYFYALTTDVESSDHGALVKVDRESGQCWFWRDDDCFPSEPIFIPRPGATEEDDGVVVSALTWGRRPLDGALVVIEAKEWRECARAELTLPSPQVRTFHGCFRPADIPVQTELAA